MTLRIAILGKAQLSRDERPINLPGYRPLALLAYLLISGRPQSRRHLVDLLFEQPDDPRGALRWTLSQLRKVLGPDVILANRQDVSYNFESDYWLDVTAFEAGVIDLYRGELLEGIYLRGANAYNAWLLVERERLRALYQAGLEARLQEQQRAENSAGVELTALKLLEMDNLREDWQRTLMAAYARQGKFAAALAQYDLCRQILLEELNQEPAPETTALAAEIAGQQANHSVTAARSGNMENGHSASRGEEGNEESRTADRESQSARASLEGLSFGRMAPAAVLVGVLALLILALLVRQLASGGIFGDGRAEANLAGRSVTIAGPITEDGLELFEKSLAPFEERSGIDVEVGIFQDDYNDVLPSLIESGLAPDIVQIPQPGLAAEFLSDGLLVEVRSFLDDAYLEQQYGPALLDAALIDGRMAGVWYKNNIKSLVWYAKDDFDEAGYTAPQTWDNLVSLSDRMVADGRTPWCIGVESGSASGWVGTDWVEDILLRTAPAARYDDWVAGRLPFDSPEIRRVFAIMESIWLDEAYVLGGSDAILEEAFYDSPVHLFEEPPGCYLHKQSSFITEFFPDDAVFGRDYDFFYLPPIEEELGRPVLGAGDMMVMFNDRPEVREVMRYLTTAESVRYYVESGGFIAPQRDAPFEWYRSAAQLKMAQLLNAADTYRFDGSDAMPAEVGSGSFWQGILDWTAGRPLDAVLREIDASWPEVQEP